MIVFSGSDFSQQIELNLTTQVSKLLANGAQRPSIAAVLFVEDSGSRLYTKLKRAAAERIGISYDVYEVSIHDDLKKIVATVQDLANDPSVTGIIIQKPWGKTWRAVYERHGLLSGQTAVEKRAAFAAWWRALTSEIPLEKDVDGLHPSGQSIVLSATARAVGIALCVAASAQQELPVTTAELLHTSSPAFSRLWSWLEDKRIVIAGKSDIVGIPLHRWLTNHLGDAKINLVGRSIIESPIFKTELLRTADVVISCTGVHHLFSASNCKPGSVLVDVGEPRADIELDAVTHLPETHQPFFVTPVPGGIGPMTVSCLMANAIQLCQTSDNESAPIF